MEVLRAPLSAIVVAACLGCSVAPTEELLPTRPPEPPKPAIKADVLFVVDNSGGSLPKQERLIAAFPRFLAALDGADLRIGVVSTDVLSSDGEREGQQQ